MDERLHYWNNWASLLDPSKRETLEKALTPTLPPYVPHRPEVPQAVFLAIDAKEALYGGAAGGGKSDALLMAALQYVHVPDYSALLLRKTYADLSLPDAIMDRAKRWLMGVEGVKWNQERREFRFPSGASLVFGYLETDIDKYRYQGAAFQFIGIDEVTQFPEASYTYLLSRLRRASTSEVPLRMRAASNPGGIGHEWVYQRFIPRFDPRVGKIVTPTDTNGTPRIFVPARLDDNPHLDQDAYRGMLAELDDVTKAHLLDGAWDVTGIGDLFQPQSLHNVVDEVPWAECRWVRYWDLAATQAKPGRDPDYTVGALMGKAKNGMTYVADIQRVRMRPDGVEALVRQCAETDPPHTSIRMEQEPGASGVMAIDHYQRRILYGYDFVGVRSTGPKDVRARAIAAAANRGTILLLRAPWNAALQQEAYAFPKSAHDDQVDALSGGFSELRAMYSSASATVGQSNGKVVGQRPTLSMRTGQRTALNLRSRY